MPNKQDPRDDFERMVDAATEALKPLGIDPTHYQAHQGEYVRNFSQGMRGLVSTLVLQRRAPEIDVSKTQEKRLNDLTVAARVLNRHTTAEKILEAVTVSVEQSLETIRKRSQRVVGPYTSQLEGPDEPMSYGRSS